MISWLCAVVVLLAAAATGSSSTAALATSAGASGASTEVPRPQPAIAATDEAAPKKVGPNTRVYTNQFVLQVRGGEGEARKVAERHGFVYLNHILADYYHLEHRRLAKRSLSATQDALNISIESEPQVSS